MPKGSTQGEVTPNKHKVKQQGKTKAAEQRMPKVNVSKSTKPNTELLTKTSSQSKTAKAKIRD